ncbi:MAG: single-stranded DNA-binding protein [Acidimicrobiia bacterium]|nr:single-stranded DNA-binding protein [Acidimicrobiia bacterium]
MAFDNTVSIVGNVTRDPELRFTPSGAPVCTFGVAWNRRYERGGEQVEDVSFFDVTCWRSLAENVAESITKGTRVIVYGRLDQRSWETPDGEKRNKVEIVADEVAPSLRWASAQVNRNEFREGNGTAPRRTAAPGGSPARAATPSYGDEEPF